MTDLRARLRRATAGARALRRGSEGVARSHRRTLRAAAVEDLHALLRGLRWVGVTALSPLLAPDPPPRPPRSGLARAAPLLLWVATVLLIIVGVPDIAQNYRMAGLSTLVFAVAAALPLGLAQRTPLQAWRLLVAVAVVAPVLVAPAPAQGHPWPATQVWTALVVCFMVALRHRWRTVLAVWALTVAVMAWGLSWLSSTATGEQLPGATLLLGMVLLVGYLTGVRGELARRLAEGERLREESERQRAVLEERARIARELHDVVAHHMSMISVQAETAPFRAPDLGERGRASMADIAATAREALTEMRRLLGVLRDDDTQVELAPQPSLTQLDRLVAGARRAGLTVDLAVTGDARPLPPGIQLSAYRIVQEGLSNAAWHAPNARVRVLLEHRPGVLRVLVHNGPPPVAPGAPTSGRGHGLVGMRERVALHGGTLETGPTADGGYRVDATLPLHDQGSDA